MPSSPITLILRFDGTARAAHSFAIPPAPTPAAARRSARLALVPHPPKGASRSRRATPAPSPLLILQASHRLNQITLVPRCHSRISSSRLSSLHQRLFTLSSTSPSHFPFLIVNRSSHGASFLVRLPVARYHPYCRYKLCPVTGNNSPGSIRSQGEPKVRDLAFFSGDQASL